MKHALPILIIGLASFWSGVSNAGSYQTLGKSSKSTTILALGKAPPKQKKNLHLGDIRTREARLPNGVLTLEGRMKLRSKQALNRQKELNKAKRKPPENVSPGDEIYTNDMGSKEMR